MAFFSSAVDLLQTLVIALGAGLGIWGVVNLMEGYGNDNPGANAPGLQQAHRSFYAPRPPFIAKDKLFHKFTILYHIFKPCPWTNQPEIGKRPAG